ncbi:hypothetical protein TRIUR3_34121 [Triticum urartu]|uniref:Photosystem I subunit O n=2 Tax=Triticum TaxID=4564 RepID=A0A9R1R8M3_TRITD|nr:hypothetical protein TRIUR3_34121 [Triticum urartu]VAH32255.1 unnamed protein product [Triticum turgidum subsp. durum]
MAPQQSPPLVCSRHRASPSVPVAGSTHQEIRASRPVLHTETFPRDWLRRDLNVIGFGLIGWLAPSSIPLINGNSLTGLFFSSIGEELAHFPSPPALQSQFWLWLVTWHLGLFIALTFGQIGFKGRTEDYFQK